MMFLFNYLKLGLWSTIYYYRQSDIVFDIILNTIKKSGPIIIKFIQWTLPKIESIYNIDKLSKENEWFYKLEELYEDCDFHSIQYTKNTYQQVFNEDFDKEYKSIEEVASGSIGQVYKITDKNDSIFAMKILHPNVSSEIQFYKTLFTIINSSRK